MVNRATRICKANRAIQPSAIHLSGTDPCALAPQWTVGWNCVGKQRERESKCIKV